MQREETPSTILNTLKGLVFAFTSSEAESEVKASDLVSLLCSSSKHSRLRLRSKWTRRVGTGWRGRLSVVVFGHAAK